MPTASPQADRKQCTREDEKKNREKGREGKRDADTPSPYNGSSLLLTVAAVSGGSLFGLYTRNPWLHTPHGWEGGERGQI